ncbi:HlyD family efflux transporter periplasmic adaptor subunit [soil metagenome]
MKSGPFDGVTTPQPTPTKMRARTAVLLTSLFACCIAACSGDGGVPASAASAASAARQHYVAMARGRVDVEGGVQRVLAPREGVIAQMQVEVGDNVKAGQALATLTSRQAELSVATVQAELTQAQAQVGAQRARLPALQSRAARLKEAAAAGAASGQSADDARAAAVELQADIGVGEANLAAARQKLVQARQAVDLSTVRAPAAGRVLERLAQAGDNVAALAILYTLRPDKPMIVRAELNESLVEHVKIGMRAEVVSAGDEGPVYTAQVIRVGELFGPSRLGDDARDGTDARSVECVLKLDASTLRIGQRVLVRFVPA